MKPKVEDPEQNGDPTPEAELEEEQTSVTETQTQQSDDDGGNEPVTKERYAGLQRVLAKRDKSLKELQEKLTNLAAEVEEKSSQSGMLAKDKATLEATLADLQKQVEQATQEKLALNNKLEQQALILEKFPHLGGLAKYIPAGVSAEEFSTNAEKFSTELKAFIESQVGEKLKGSSHSPQEKSEEVTASEEDKLWREVYRYAGTPGKEKEYREANDRLQQLLASRNT